MAEGFFTQTLPADLGRLKNKMLATLFVRKARVLSRLGRGTEARELLARALKLCADAAVCRRAVAAWGISWIGSNAINGLRRIKRIWLRTFVRR